MSALYTYFQYLGLSVLSFPHGNCPLFLAHHFCTFNIHTAVLQRNLKLHEPHGENYLLLNATVTGGKQKCCSAPAQAGHLK
jgi:hypothetical protein